MKTKQQILKKVYEDNFTSQPYEKSNFGHTYKEVSELAMDEWAKRVACLFLEWLPDSGWRIYPICEEGEDQLWYRDSGDINIPDEQMTTSQLYDYFLQSIQQP